VIGYQFLIFDPSATQQHVTEALPVSQHDLLHTLHFAILHFAVRSFSGASGNARTLACFRETEMVKSQLSQLD